MLKPNLLLTLGCLLSGCNRPPPPWTGPAISLAPAEHAYAYPLRAVAMVPGSSDLDLEPLLAKHCAKPEEEEAPAMEEEEGELPEDPDFLERRKEQSDEQSLSEALSLLEQISPDQGEDPPEIEWPQFPEALASPAIAVVTLEEISWMGTPVIPLQDGALFPAAVDGLVIPSLYESLRASVTATLEIAELCRISWPGNALLAVDARVPLSTVYRVMYTMGQAQFGSIAFVVDDPDPVASRVDAPVGGLWEAGNVIATSSEYLWQRDGQESLQWSGPSAPPPALGESTPPRGLIRLAFDDYFGTFASLHDSLAGMGLFCVYASLPREGEDVRAAPMPEIKPDAPLVIGAGGTVSVLLHEFPAIGSPRYPSDPEHVWLGRRQSGALCSIQIALEMTGTSRVSELSEPAMSLESALGVEQPALGSGALLGENSAAESSGQK